MKKIINFLKKFILWILKLFGITFQKTTTENLYSKVNIITKKTQENDKNRKIENTDTNEAHNLTKEQFFIQENNKLTKEEIETHFNLFIEKTFKLKLNNLPEETKKELETYKMKIVPEIEKKKIETLENLEIIFKEKLKEDLEKKKINFEEIKTNPKLYFINQTTETKKEMQDKMTTAKIPILEPSITKQEKPLEKTYTLEKNYESKTLSTIPISSETKIEEEIVSIAPILNQKKKRENSLEPMENILTTEEESLVQKEEAKEQTPQENKQNEEKNGNKNKEIKKEPEKEIYMNLHDIEQENMKIIEEAKQEWNKEDLIDKNYEIVEKLLEEKINDIEKKLQKPLSDIQKKTLTREMEKLKETKQQLHLYKEKDIEELRNSLEENIPLDELMLVTDKLKKLTEDEEIKRKEILYKDIENKTNKEMQEMERVLIKESYKRALRRFEMPLFLSFPFIKNKHFRRFVSGLFLFRTFGFIKNLVFGFPNTYEPLDLSYIQKGSDALIESIDLIEKNITSFQNLKQATLLKYPELTEDEDFMKDINKLEENLKKNYEKLLKQEKLVNKYFDKSKIFTRKRKLAA